MDTKKKSGTPNKSLRGDRAEGSRHVGHHVGHLENWGCGCVIYRGGSVSYIKERCKPHQAQYDASVAEVYARGRRGREKPLDGNQILENLRRMRG